MAPAAVLVALACLVAGVWSLRHNAAERRELEASAHELELSNAALALEYGRLTRGAEERLGAVAAAWARVGELENASAEGEAAAARARSRGERDLALHHAALGPDAPQTLGAAARLGRVDLAAGRFDQARARFAEALVGSRKTLGSDHPRTLDALLGLGAA
ncbi:MAG: tetratricopeptide repeat protein, partial [Planctomycetota bacterium]|nr:tetratricopeptide repeat protein [Planctomycetota bacterium]